ncbi:MAG: hypothetical protein ABJF23_32020 [Bryobacteraceae bacterium]
MKSKSLTCLRATVLAAICALPLAAQFSGSLKAVLPDGSKAAGDIFDSKARVFFSAGPQNAKSSGLPDGRYYFQVTDPSGAVLLSNDAAVCRQVVVSGGGLAGAFDPVTQTLESAGSPLDTTNCEHATTGQTGSVAVQAGGVFHACATGARLSDIFCDTSNPGGEYKLWLIAQSSAIAACTPTVNPDGVSLRFNQKCAKTDNFSLTLPAISHLAACKFNDTNGNGVLDTAELMISGWPITASVPAASYVTLRSDNQGGTSITANTDSTGCVSFAALGIPVNGQVAVTLTEASQVRWKQTAPANGTYDASGKPSASGPTSLAGAASGGVITANLGSGTTVAAPYFGNTDPECPDCSILGSLTVTNTPTPAKLYTWGISKTVDKTQIDNVPLGGNATFNYTVSVTHDSGGRPILTGIVTLINADGTTPLLVVNVTDAVSDGGVCKIKNPGTGVFEPELFNVNLNAFTQISLPYQCTYADGVSPTIGTNTVTAVNVSDPSSRYTSAAFYNFGSASSILDDSVTVIDSLTGALGTVSSTDASPKTFSYPYTFSGGTAGSCTPHDNTATFTTKTTGSTGAASQSVKVCLVKSTVSLTTSPSPTSVTLAASPVILKNSATLSGGVNPTGSITFTLLYNGSVVYTVNVAVSGNGTYTSPGYTLPTTGAVTGIYQWNASYSGDGANLGASETGNAAERATVVNAKPALVVSPVGEPNGNGAYLVGSSIGAAATLSRAYNPTGTLTFTLFHFTGPGVREILCTETVAVNGNGTYSKPNTCVIPNLGSLQWGADYSGDSNNNVPTEARIDFSLEL